MGMRRASDDPGRVTEAKGSVLNDCQRGHKIDVDNLKEGQT